MVRFRDLALGLALTTWAFGAGGGACSSEPLVSNGTCVVDPNPELHCGKAVGDAGAETDTLGLTGYTCSGTARPDESPHYDKGIPRGRVCADRGALGSDRVQGYCCTAEETSCAYNPVGICDAPTYGSQCRGANRPEALNAKYCSVATASAQGDNLNYCCAGKEPPSDGCLQTDSVGCSTRLMGFSCTGDNPSERGTAGRQQEPGRTSTISFARPPRLPLALQDQELLLLHACPRS